MNAPRNGMEFQPITMVISMLCAGDCHKLKMSRKVIEAVNEAHRSSKIIMKFKLQKIKRLRRQDLMHLG